ncbi:sarcosine oxidase subunit gamma (plasmid) [Rhizobium sullae]|uniref:Sarcosine oxidase subunit gamma n=1 Tax=Rhizobium sullae TaxID=50338 RepID=A0A2N0D1R7_RHISU|nr:sarcosine oxidase subunit gamma [Rhizobium sullae]PKA40070.1 sarcosine oxidase subunit gamma family protein [Rhizobium sullae]UWU17992.1 sarcosine oxidase subunit gamma [Rhizobium sullae]
MSDFRPTLRPVLGAKLAISSAAVRLSSLPEGAVIHVLARPSEQDVASVLDGLARGAALTVRPVSPGQWFIIGEEPMTFQDMKALFDALEPRATGVDQSHGRVRIRISGKMAARVLSKGTAVDLASGSFPVGQSATTLIGHIVAHITCIDAETFEIIVLRGFAESLWDDLARMSAEFG